MPFRDNLRTSALFSVKATRMPNQYAFQTVTCVYWFENAVLVLGARHVAAPHYPIGVTLSSPRARPAIRGGTVQRGGLVESHCGGGGGVPPQRRQQWQHVHRPSRRLAYKIANGNDRKQFLFARKLPFQEAPRGKNPLQPDQQIHVIASVFPLRNVTVRRYQHIHVTISPPQHLSFFVHIAPSSGRFWKFPFGSAAKRVWMFLDYIQQQLKCQSLENNFSASECAA